MSAKTSSVEGRAYRSGGAARSDHRADERPFEASREDRRPGSVQQADEIPCAITASVATTALSTGSPNTSSQPVEVIAQGNPPLASTGPFGDRDVSIVKLGGVADLPTVAVDNDADVEAGQPIFVDGHPAAAAGGQSTASTPAPSRSPARPRSS